MATSALAQDGGKGTQTQQGPGGGSGEGAGAGGGQGGGGEAGEAEDSDCKGPQANQPTGDQGGTPAWAAEGIPEIELGRLNVIRSPEQVLERALAEVVANFDPSTMESLYESTAAAFAAAIQANWDTITIIDSPLENLALLSEIWRTGSTSLPEVSPASMVEFSAILIGSASDKNIPVTDNTVLALATIVGVEISPTLISMIASRAEDVRIAILLAHGA